MSEAVRALVDNWLVLVVLIFFVAWLLGTIVEEIGKYARHRKDVELKRDLADRGLSAADIARIVESGSTNGREVKVEDDRLVNK